ncbi:MAG: SpoIIE family protein phosphatase [Planctomycetes bacterium]|nr:SpoIIE family protein phosphatase [Planctomycetota bacterium]
MPRKRELLAEEALHRLLDVAQALSGSADLTAILSVIIDAMRDLLQADRATVFELDPERDELFSTVAHGLTASVELAEIRFSSAQGLAGEAFQTGKIINVPDAYEDDRFNREVDRSSGFRTKSLLTIPLVGDDGRRVGVAQVLNKREGSFDDDDEALAAALAAQAAVAIRRGRLIEESLVRQRMERELELAKDIQTATLPKRLPSLPGFDLAAWCEPAEETGGDALDVIGIGGTATAADPDGDCVGAVLLVADAVGHGVGPALSVTQLRSMVRMAARLGASVPEVASMSNEQLNRDLPGGRFITAWFGRLDATTSVMEYLSAGQAPILRYVAADDLIEMRSSDALPAGILPQLDLPAPNRFEMAAGDLFAILSDGIYEAFNTAGEQFGNERVEAVIRASHDGSADDIANAIRDAVDAFAGAQPADDDRTVLIIKKRT